MRFSINDNKSQEESLGMKPESYANFSGMIKSILIDDFMKPNNFQLPLFSSQFAQFHYGLKNAYSVLMKHKHYEEELIDILTSFMSSNYELFIRKILLTFDELAKKYLSSIRTIFDSNLIKQGMNDAIYDISSKAIKTDIVQIFELFCNIMKHILGSCNNKEVFFSLLDVINQFMGRIYESFREAFDNDVADSHYMIQFDRTYYTFEKDSQSFSNVKFPFLYLDRKSVV